MRCHALGAALAPANFFAEAHKQSVSGADKCCTTNGYKDYVSRIDVKIVLIDGKTLARLMFEYGLGVSTYRTFEVKRIDSDYFSEG